MLLRKTCNGLHGLKLHHRSCRIIQGLGELSIEDVRVDSNDNNVVDNSVPTNITNIMSLIKPGIKLLKLDALDALLQRDETLKIHQKNLQKLMGEVYKTMNH